MTKTCNRCKQDLPVESFSKNKAAKDGLQGRCKPCAKESYTEWRLANPDKARANSYKQTAKLKAKNPTYNTDYQRNRYQKDSEYRQRVQAQKRHRRAVLMGAEGEVTPEQFAELCLLYGGICLDCKSGEKPLTMDHVVPLSLGGSHTIQNIQPLCLSCNSKKGNRSSTDFRSEILH